MHLSQKFSYMYDEMWDDLQLQLAAEVLQHLQLLRSRVSSCLSAHVQFLDETKVAQQQWKHSKVGQQELCFVVMMLLLNDRVQLCVVFALGRCGSFSDYGAQSVIFGATSWPVVQALHSMLLFAFHCGFMFFSRVVCVCFEVCFVVLKRRLF